MASLTLSVATISSEITANDQKATNILSDVVALKDGPVGGTNQEQLDFITALLKSQLQDWSYDCRKSPAINTATSTIHDDPNYHWED